VIGDGCDIRKAMTAVAASQATVRKNSEPRTRVAPKPATPVEVG